MYEDTLRGNPIHKPKPRPPPEPMPPLHQSIFVLAFVLSIVPGFALADYWVESSVVHVEGTFEKECNYYTGGVISNGSEPMNWIQVDGEKYIAREVDFDRFGDTGDSLIGRFDKGDQVDMDLFPYEPYNLVWDGHLIFVLVLIFPLLTITYIRMRYPLCH